MHTEVHDFEAASTTRAARTAGELLAADSRAVASRLLEYLDPEAEEFL